MEETQRIGEGLTFEKVWATIQETGKQVAETSRRLSELGAETDRRLAETSQEIKALQAGTSKEIKALQEGTSQEIKELSKNVGGINNSFGRWAEEIISAKLWEKFKDLGYTFTHGGSQKYWQGKRTVCQVDMLLENGDYAMPVEIKSVLSKHDVDEHLKRLEKVREELDKRGDQRKLVGAVAGMVVEEDVRKYAQERGLYVLVQSGDSVEVAGFGGDLSGAEMVRGRCPIKGKKGEEGRIYD
ncbi:MAG: hypothetical protein LBG27_13500 [Spirochaetaceae bacterium]|jgi:hypothetical protein|nr:hypothetical protein [Spirochaetaceae bacterium]